mmetsp:Transcript_10620/g.30441  ORF Transcript_10620/g.30441 Transcript_10620/m.30441 type:complete len:536 (-) Transcript_10620:1190-2797(-)
MMRQASSWVWRTAASTSSSNSSSSGSPSTAASNSCVTRCMARTRCKEPASRSRRLTIVSGPGAPRPAASPPSRQASKKCRVGQRTAEKRVRSPAQQRPLATSSPCFVASPHRVKFSAVARASTASLTWGRRTESRSAMFSRSTAAPKTANCSRATSRFASVSAVSAALRPLPALPALPALPPLRAPAPPPSRAAPILPVMSAHKSRRSASTSFFLAWSTSRALMAPAALVSTPVSWEATKTSLSRLSRALKLLRCWEFEITDESMSRGRVRRARRLCGSAWNLPRRSGRAPRRCTERAKPSGRASAVPLPPRRFFLDWAPPCPPGPDPVAFLRPIRAWQNSWTSSGVSPSSTKDRISLSGSSRSKHEVIAVQLQRTSPNGVSIMASTKGATSLGSLSPTMRLQKSRTSTICCALCDSTSASCPAASGKLSYWARMMWTNSRRSSRLADGSKTRDTAWSTSSPSTSSSSSKRPVEKSSWTSLAASSCTSSSTSWRSSRNLWRNREVKGRSCWAKSSSPYKRRRDAREVRRTVASLS